MRRLVKCIAAILLVTVLITAAAGCTGTGGTTDNNGSSTGSGQLMSVGSHITQTETGEQAVKTYVRNSGSNTVANAVVTIKFYDNQGILIDTESVTVTDIGPNQGQDVIIPCHSEEAISRYEITIR